MSIKAIGSVALCALVYSSITCAVMYVYENGVAETASEIKAACKRLINR